MAQAVRFLIDGKAHTLIDLNPTPTVLEPSFPDLAGAAPGRLASETESGGAAAHTGSDDLVMIMTHDHALDCRLTHAALGSQAGFVGLIGSAIKRARFVRRLRDDGVDEAGLGRLCCPVGLPGVEGKEPEVIAVAVAAQLLTLRGARSAGQTAARESPPPARPCIAPHAARR